MKRELTVVILVLAAAMFSWKSWDGFLSLPTKESQDQHVLLATERRNLSQSEQPIVRHATNSATDILTQVIHGLRYCQPFRSEFEIQLDCFDEKFSIKGTYGQAGEGTPRARMELFDPRMDSPQLIQLFDGRFYYMLEPNVPDSPLKFADLEPILKLPEPSTANVTGKKGWFGIGNIAVLLEQLSCAFDLQEIIPGEQENQISLANSGSRVMRGPWKAAVLRQLARDQLTDFRANSTIEWSRIPKQIPHVAEVTIGQGDFGPSFPVRIVFYQYQNEQTADARLVPMVSIAFQPLVPLDSNNAKLFELNSAHSATLDLTGEYLNRVKMFLFQPFQ